MTTEEGARIIEQERRIEELEKQLEELTNAMAVCEPMVKKVNICGIPHDVIECEDTLGTETHFGMIDYQKCEIKINKDLTDEAKAETLCHEILHGIFIHLGYEKDAENEQYIQCLAQAINQSFTVRGSE